MELEYLKYVCLTYWKHNELVEKLREITLFIDCKGYKGRTNEREIYNTTAVDTLDRVILCRN